MHVQLLLLLLCKLKAIRLNILYLCSAACVLKQSDYCTWHFSAGFVVAAAFCAILSLIPLSLLLLCSAIYIAFKGLGTNLNKLAKYKLYHNGYVHLLQLNILYICALRWSQNRNNDLLQLNCFNGHKAFNNRYKQGIYGIAKYIIWPLGWYDVTTFSSLTVVMNINYQITGINKEYIVKYVICILGRS